MLALFSHLGLKTPIPGFSLPHSRMIMCFLCWDWKLFIVPRTIKPQTTSNGRQWTRMRVSSQSSLTSCRLPILSTISCPVISLCGEAHEAASCLEAHLLSLHMTVSSFKDIENILMFLRLEEYYLWWQTINADFQADHFIAWVCRNSDFLRKFCRADDHLN